MEMIKKLQMVWYEEYSTGESDALAVLYHNVMDEYQDVSTSKSYDKLWAEIAPSGNIYRYCSLMSERLRHCWDLQQQMRHLATEHSVLLGGGTEDVRVQKLVNALKRTTVTIDGDAAAVPGFKPIEEFVCDPVEKQFGMVVPCDKDARGLFHKNNFTGVLVLVIQLIAPLIMCIEQVNKAEQLSVIFAPSSYSFAEVVCLGNDLIEQLTTIMGTLFMILVLTIIKTYSDDEESNAEKSGRLPFDDMWHIIGVLANWWCVFLTIIATPLLYWNEDDASGVVMDSLQLLFIFTLDDLTGGCCDYLGQDDSDFQRAAAYNYALLSQCPVKLTDVINSQAGRVEDLWKLGTSSGGRLMSARQSRIESGPEAAVETRIMVKREATEAVELGQVAGGPAGEVFASDQAVGRARSASVVAKITLEELADSTVVYHVAKDRPASQLPGPGSNIVIKMWKAMAMVAMVSQWIVPALFGMMNNPCYAGKHMPTSSGESSSGVNATLLATEPGYSCNLEESKCVQSDDPWMAMPMQECESICRPEEGAVLK